MKQFEEGIYFGLDEAEYHADPSLGSTSIKQLSVDPRDWWFNSPHNPVRLEKEDRPALVIGRAYHKLVLEGEAALRRSFGVKDWDGRTTEGKAKKAAFEESGMTEIEEMQWNRILLAGAAVRANVHLREAFSGGMSEVSIFWNADGVPKKARIDHLKVRANSDLKTISPQDGKNFRESCIRQMATYNYPAQAAHYNEGRAQIGRLMREGLVHGDHDADLLKKIAGTSRWASVFTFLKKTNAPLTFGLSISPGNPLLEIGQDVCMRAVQNYTSFRDRFGLDTPWLTAEPLEELSIEEIPAWWKP